MQDMSASVPAPRRLTAPPDAQTIPLSPPRDRQPRVLKHGEVFALFDARGDIDPREEEGAGLYRRDTRRLSRYQLTLAGRAPLLLSSTIALGSGVLKADCANPDLRAEDGATLSRDTIHVARAKFLHESGCSERIVVRNYGADRTVCAPALITTSERHFD